MNFRLVIFVTGQYLKISRKTWRQIWRMAERESGSPELLESPRTSLEVLQTSHSPVSVELNSNQEVFFSEISQTCLEVPRKLAAFFGSLTPSPD